MSDITPQKIADALALVVPRRWGVHRVEIVWAAGGQRPACVIRALIGPNAHHLHEISGLGDGPTTAAIVLHNNVRLFEVPRG